ncbi:MAG: magnesium transporter CorA family protein [Planctomycetota bacterium]|nr:magnesium transporter CorA family protein [Planctomycetota bacterium]
MLKRYKLDNARPVETADGTGPVYLYVAPTDAEKMQLLGEFPVDEHTLASALDPDELPRMELESDHLAVIFKYPKRLDQEDRFNLRVQSLGLFLFKDRLLIVAPDDEPILEGRVYAKTGSPQLLFLRVISKCIQHFYGHLKAINDIANELEPKIMTAMENRYLLLMFSIEKSLVYYVNAISANGRVIERLCANAKNISTEGLSPELLDYVEDLGIENAQCHEQAQIHANVLAGLMDARASIVSNNLNVLMKRLTVISVVFMPLNVLAGVGGMSEFSMMTQNIPWPVSYTLFMLGLAAIGWATYYVLKSLERSAVRP